LKSYIVLPTAVLCFCWHSLPAIAESDTRLAQAVDKLFDVGWKPSFTARQPADRQIEAIRQFASGNHVAEYAYSIVLIKQRRYAEAGASLDQVLHVDAKNRHAQKAKVWLSVLMKRYAASLLEIDRLNDLFADTEARFLGTIIGYLEGPVATQVSQVAVRDRREEILMSMDKAEQAQFEAARQNVAERFASFTTEKTDTERKAKEQAEKEREVLLKDLEKQREQMATRRKEIEPKKQKLLSEMKAEIAEIEKQERPLVRQLARIESQAAVVRRELLLISSDINRLRFRAERERDPIIRNQLRLEADRLSFLARRYDNDLLVFERRAVVVNSERVELLRKFQIARTSYQTQLDQISRELGEIGKQERRNSVDQKKGLKPAQRDRRRSRALAAKAKALTTYLNFPLEAEKQRIRELFKTK